jgi:hypothetical protein
VIPEHRAPWPEHGHHLSTGILIAAKRSPLMKKQGGGNLERSRRWTAAPPSSTRRAGSRRRDSPSTRHGKILRQRWVLGRSHREVGHSIRIGFKAVVSRAKLAAMGSYKESAVRRGSRAAAIRDALRADERSRSAAVRLRDLHAEHHRPAQQTNLSRGGWSEIAHPCRQHVQSLPLGLFFAGRCLRLASHQRGGDAADTNHCIGRCL